MKHMNTYHDGHENHQEMHLFFLKRLALHILRGKQSITQCPS